MAARRASADAALEILVVDDDAAIRNMLQRILKKRGYAVRCYATAEDARTAVLRASLDAAPIDCVLLDMALEPGSSDTRAAEALLHELTQRQPKPEVVLMSAQLSYTEFFRLVMRGAADFVAKPWETSDLLDRIEKCSEVGRSRHRHHYRTNAELPESARDAFLSYASANQELALGLRRVLERMHITTWYAPADVSPGEQWPKSLDAALVDCQVFLVLLTPASLKSDYVMKEVGRALGRKDAERDSFLFVPVTSGVTPQMLPDRLKAFQVVDITDEHRMVDNIIRMRDCIAQFLSTRFSAVPFERRRVERRGNTERRASGIH